MKCLLKSIFVAFLFLLSIVELKADHKEGKRYVQPDPFVVTKKYVDTILAEGTAVLKFTFFGGGTTKSKTVRYGMNKKETKFTTDTNGRYTKNVTAGNYKLYFYLNSEYKEVISDTLKIKSKEVLEITVRFISNKNNNIKVKKPVIYVYPEETSEINIELDVNGKLGFTYPTYNNGWNFTATPDGKITMNDKEYNYLFWESEMPEIDMTDVKNSGFIVSSDTLLDFLENSLDQMGFTSVESADFITFWYPQMIKNENNYVHFLFNEACAVYAELKITPVPDHVYRVGMIWGEANETDLQFEPQKIQEVDRSGFTIVEWGGAEMEEFTLPLTTAE